MPSFFQISSSPCQNNNHLVLLQCFLRQGKTIRNKCLFLRNQNTGTDLTDSRDPLRLSITGPPSALAPMAQRRSAHHGAVTSSVLCTVEADREAIGASPGRERPRLFFPPKYALPLVLLQLRGGAGYSYLWHYLLHSDCFQSLCHRRLSPHTGALSSSKLTHASNRARHTHPPL